MVVMKIPMYLHNTKKLYRCFYSYYSSATVNGPRYDAYKHVHGNWFTGK